MGLEWFEMLGRHERLAAVQEMGREAYMSGEVIIVEGELLEQKMYVVVEGAVSEASAEPARMAMLGIGETFCKHTLIIRDPSPDPRP